MPPLQTRKRHKPQKARGKPRTRPLPQQLPLDMELHLPWQIPKRPHRPRRLSTTPSAAACTAR